MKDRDIKLRKFALDDLKRVVEIAGNSFEHQYSRKYFEKFYQQYPDGFVVAEIAGSIVGYIIGQPKDSAGLMVSMAVRVSDRKIGIGKSLVNFIIEHFKQLGLEKVYLHTRVNNQSAISFFQKMGFKAVRTIKNYYPNNDNAYLVEKIF